MKILRVSMYPPGNDPPIACVVMREVDLKIPIDQAAKDYENSMPGGFIVCDIFELPGEPDIIEATTKSMEIVESQREREENMALTYYFEAAHLHLTQPGGVLTMTRPAPLSVDDLAVPLRQLANHPDYDRHTVVAISYDGRIVELRNGEVSEAHLGT